MMCYLDASKGWLRAESGRVGRMCVFTARLQRSGCLTWSQSVFPSRTQGLQAGDAHRIQGRVRGVFELVCC